MKINFNNLQNGQAFKGYIKFNNQTINTDEIASYKSETLREYGIKPLDCLPHTCIKGKRLLKSYRVFNANTQQLDWIQFNRANYDGIYADYSPDFHDGIIDYVDGELKLKNGKKYKFSTEKLVVPPTLSQLKVRIGNKGYVEQYEKMPEPPLYTFDAIVKKASKSKDEIVEVDGCLNKKSFWG